MEASAYREIYVYKDGQKENLRSIVYPIYLSNKFHRLFRFIFKNYSISPLSCGYDDRALENITESEAKFLLGLIDAVEPPL